VVALLVNEITSLCSSTNVYHVKLSRHFSASIHRNLIYPEDPCSTCSAYTANYPITTQRASPSACCTKLYTPLTLCMFGPVLSFDWPSLSFVPTKNVSLSPVYELGLAGIRPSLPSPRAYV
jgi:hypothetical protein